MSETKLTVTYSNGTISIAGGTGPDPGDLAVDPGTHTIVFEKGDKNEWGFALFSVDQGPADRPGCFVIRSWDRDRIKITDYNCNESGKDQIYKYSLSVYDGATGAVVVLDPKIRNRSN